MVYNSRAPWLPLAVVLPGPSTTPPRSRFRVASSFTLRPCALLHPLLRSLRLHVYLEPAELAVECGVAGQGHMLVLLALKCFQAWLALDVSGGGSALLSSGELAARHPQLFQALLAALGSQDGAVLALAADTLARVLGALRSQVLRSADS